MGARATPPFMVCAVVPWVRVVSGSLGKGSHALCIALQALVWNDEQGVIGFVIFFILL